MLKNETRNKLAFHFTNRYYCCYIHLLLFVASHCICMCIIMICFPVYYVRIKFPSSAFLCITNQFEYNIAYSSSLSSVAVRLHLEKQKISHFRENYSNSSLLLFSDCVIVRSIDHNVNWCFIYFSMSNVHSIIPQSNAYIIYNITIRIIYFSSKMYIYVFILLYQLLCASYLYIIIIYILVIVLRI